MLPGISLLLHPFICFVGVRAKSRCLGKLPHPLTTQQASKNGIFYLQNYHNYKISNSSFPPMRTHNTRWFEIGYLFPVIADTPGLLLPVFMTHCGQPDTWSYLMRHLLRSLRLFPFHFVESAMHAADPDLMISFGVYTILAHVFTARDKYVISSSHALLLIMASANGLNNLYSN